jgi:hypothetical protein
LEKTEAEKCHNDVAESTEDVLLKVASEKAQVSMCILGEARGRERNLVVQTSPEEVERGETAEEVKVATIEKTLPTHRKENYAKVPEELWNGSLPTWPRPETMTSNHWLR